MGEGAKIPSRSKTRTMDTGSELKRMETSTDWEPVDPSQNSKSSNTRVMENSLSTLPTMKDTSESSPTEPPRMPTKLELDPTEDSTSRFTTIRFPNQLSQNRSSTLRT